MDERIENWNTFVKDWFPFADRFLDIAIQLAKGMNPMPNEAICFYCHEAVQNYLMAYLAHRTGEKPAYIDDIPQLIEMCAVFDGRFRDLEAIGQVLSRYSDYSNYPIGLHFSTEDAEKALRYAAEIKDFPPLAELREKLEQEDAP